MTAPRNAVSRKLQISVWTVLALVLAAIVTLFVATQLRKSNLPDWGQVHPFTLTNQFGRPFGLQDLSGKVWVADIIFSRCAGPCPKMTEQMSLLQKAIPPADPVRFVTLTTDPDYDTPAVLKRYSERFGADPERWIFLTGPKAEILKNLAQGSLKLAAVEKGEGERENPNDLFIHSTIFVLVDRHGHLRGAYESLEPGFQEKIRADIAALLQEN